MAALPVSLSPTTKRTAFGGHDYWHNTVHAFWNHYAVDPQTPEGVSYAGIPATKLKVYEGSDASPITTHLGATVVISKTMNASDVLDDSNAGLYSFVKNAGRVQPVAVKGATVNTGNSDSCAGYFTSAVYLRGGAYAYFGIGEIVQDYAVTLTIASPTVCTLVGHNLQWDDEVMLTGGTLPTGITDRGRYWIFPLTADTFWLLNLPRIVAPIMAGVATGAAGIVHQVAHGYTTGDVVVTQGSTCTPSIDGAHAVTVIDADHYSVPINVTVAQVVAGGTAQKAINATGVQAGTHYITGGKVYTFNPYDYNGTHFDFNKDNPGLIMTSYIAQAVSAVAGKKAGNVMTIIGPDFAEGFVVEGGISDYLIYDRGSETNPLAWVGSYQNIWDSSGATVSGSHIKLGSNFTLGFSSGQPLLGFSTGMAYIPTAGPPATHAFYVGGSIAFAVAAATMYHAALPTIDPGAGSKQFWCDTGSGNVVKYRP